MIFVSETEGIVSMFDDFEVVVTGAEQGVVGLASTHTHRALTEARTWIPVSKPQPPMTQFCALFWITAEDSHWHPKSSLAQPASVTAAEKMHVSAQSGTASALAWHGDLEPHGAGVVPGPEEDEVIDPLEETSVLVDDSLAVLVSDLVEAVDSGAEVVVLFSVEVGVTGGELLDCFSVEVVCGVVEVLDSLGVELLVTSVVVMTVVVITALVGSGFAVATQLHTEPPAPMALPSSPALVQAAMTQPTARLWIADEEAGMQRP